MWAVTLLGGLFITVLSFIMILTVYSRLFKLYMYTAIAPIPMSTFAGETTSNVGKNFLRSYAGVCLEGAIIALACIIFSVMAASPPAVDPNVSAVTAVWSYVGELSASVSTGKSLYAGLCGILPLAWQQRKRYNWRFMRRAVINQFIRKGNLTGSTAYW